jgi:hypothetical protein
MFMPQLKLLQLGANMIKSQYKMINDIITLG